MTTGTTPAPDAVDAVGVEQTAAGGPSDRVRVAQIARETALAVPGVTGLDSGTAGSFATVGGAIRVAGVTAAAAPGVGYDVALRLVCRVVALHPLADRVRAAVIDAGARASLAVASVTIDIVDVDLEAA